MPSTAIQWLSHDDTTNILFVAFVDGDTYAYFDVEAELVAQFRAARSKGGFFARRVRGRYRYQRLGDPDQPDLIPARGSGGRAWPPRADAAH